MWNFGNSEHCQYDMYLSNPTVLLDVVRIVFWRQFLVKYVLLNISDCFHFICTDCMSYADTCSELVQLYSAKPQDVPKIMRLLRLSFTDRRKEISDMADAEVKKITQQFPYLQDIRFVSATEYLLLSRIYTFLFRTMLICILRWLSIWMMCFICLYV